MVKYRYFGPMLRAQAKWLNKMARRGWRLADTGKLDYSFVPCEPGEYQYAVDYVGNFSRGHGEDYAQFLAGCGYRTWFKNVNLQWSRGKLRWNPAGEPGARISLRAHDLDRELIIVERRGRAGEFRLYTTVRTSWTCLRGMQPEAPVRRAYLRPPSRDGSGAEALHAGGEPGLLGVRRHIRRAVRGIYGAHTESSQAANENTATRPHTACGRVF